MFQTTNQIRFQLRKMVPGIFPSTVCLNNPKFRFITRNDHFGVHSRVGAQRWARQQIRSRLSFNVMESLPSASKTLISSLKSSLEQVYLGFKKRRKDQERSGKYRLKLSHSHWCLYFVGLCCVFFLADVSKVFLEWPLSGQWLSHYTWHLWGGEQWKPFSLGAQSVWGHWLGWC